MKRILLQLLTVVLIIAAPVLLNAQQPDSARYMPALEAAANGDIIGGRATVDSILGTIQQSSSEYAEGLYWRAYLAEDAQDAERDYRRIIVDYPLSPRVENVLLKLAQVEITRGDRDAALNHLQRLALEFPNGRTRAQASYWTARILLDKNDLQRGCPAVADALARTPASNIELRNQISYLTLRCPQSSQQGTMLGADENPQSVPVPTVNNAPVTPEVTDETPAPATETVPSTASKAKPPAKTPASTAATSGKFTVQVGAYTKKSQADQFAAKLRARGFPVRVDGTTAPYRVRIGRYNTREDAAAALERIKAAKLDGFVVGN